MIMTIILPLYYSKHRIYQLDMKENKIKIMTDPISQIVGFEILPTTVIPGRGKVTNAFQFVTALDAGYFIKLRWASMTYHRGMKKMSRETLD